MRMKDELMRGAPPGTQFTCSLNGWITSEIFVKWLDHLISSAEPTADKKVLILDGHATHTKNFDAINLARQNGVIMFSLPAHTPHRLQPLDVSFFKPLSTYFSQASGKWMRSNPQCSITQFTISELLCEAYGKSATVGNAIAGFAKTGIFPLNQYVFEDCDFFCLWMMQLRQFRAQSMKLTSRRQIVCLIQNIRVTVPE
jgi:hypothetical protein